MKIHTLLVILFCSSLFAACKTASMSALHSVVIPSGLSKDAVKVAIIAAARDSKGVSSGAPVGTRFDNAFQAALAAKLLQPTEKRWFLEDNRTSSVILGYSQDEYYLRVEFVIGENEVVPHVLASNNLKQSGTEIHKGAIEWIEQFETKIRQNLGALVLDSPPPT